MHLDQTHVKVRLRTMAEIGDLSLIMIRQYPVSLLIGFFGGAIAWALVDLLVLGWIPLTEASYGLDDDEAMTEIFRYLAWMALLVMLQAPAAGVMTTLYLGLAVFEQRPTWASVLSETRRHFTRWFWKLAIVRMAIPPVILLAFRWGQPASPFWDVLVPLGLLLGVVVMRGGRPFMPEILLLEQCPLRDRSKSSDPSNPAITASRRSKALHSPMASNLSGRFMSVAFVLTALFFSFFYSLLFMRGVALGQWEWMNLGVLMVLYPLALWMVAGISVLVRLLNYLDCRIRLEGWEVELAVRAEAMRQFGDELVTVSTPPATEVAK